MASKDRPGRCEENESTESTTVPRRRVLQATGAAVASVPFVGSAAANELDDSTAVRRRANEIRSQAGQRAWRKYLKSQGFGMTSTKVGLDLDKGVGTQGFDNVDGNSSDCDICLDFSLFVDWDGVYTIDTYWTYDSEKYFGGGGYYPADAHAEYFDPQQWDYESYSLSETTYTSDKGIVNVEDDSVNDGLPFVADDGAASDGTGYWAGLNIVPINDWSERYVYGEYVHTWNETSTNYSVGASYPAGVSISFSQSTEVKKEKTGTEGDGDTLMKLRQSDAV